MHFTTGIAAALALGSVAMAKKPCGKPPHSYPAGTYTEAAYTAISTTGKDSYPTATQTGGDVYSTGTAAAGGDIYTSTTTGTGSTTQPTDTASTVPGNKFEDGDFSNGFGNFQPTGDVRTSSTGGYPNGGGCVDTGAGAAPQSRKRQAAFNGVSQTLTGLTVGNTYTFQGWYLVADNLESSDCTFDGLVNGASIATSGKLPAQDRSAPGAWKDIFGTFVPSASTADFTAAVSCSVGSAEVFLDNFSFSDQITPADLKHDSVAVQSIPAAPAAAAAPTTASSAAQPTTMQTMTSTSTIGPLVTGASVPNNGTAPMLRVRFHNRFAVRRRLH